MLDFIREHIRVAGDICRRGQRSLSIDEVDFKESRKDLVTRFDQAVERYLVERIGERFPDHDIIGEEEGERLSGSEYCWIIDPIDGTTSFCYKQPFYAVSIGLRRGTEMVAAGIYAPALEQLFLAERGGGAFLNDERLKVTSCARFDEAVLATGFACLRSGLQHNNLVYLVELLPAIRDIRRCGSAALDLAYVAAGKLDGFWELNLNLYDIAAGILLVTEAGGTVTDFYGGNAFPARGIVATNGLIDRQLLDYTGRYGEP
ncbi:inositol monophosphatase family protein [Desulfofustis glycolicus]|uniref:Inositol-1-monophosphatase n=1 Tax=Desulfofustis glycolicus DSM 9705 TaxID=1121409 RepID=A0A1M5VUQ7_9BACT|nr:inositol monophosphatase family protein [Desulfofustis glycolicus]SHH78995.1 myo-inositol-1(or 4)-monophosphatase [Desulfofustis glycolicus DSM 9705]